MPGYDEQLMAPPSFAHAIHEALIDLEEQDVEAERREGREPPARVRQPGMQARTAGATAREEARARVLDRNGRPGDGQVVRFEEAARLPEHVRGRIAVRDGRPLILGGGSTVRGQCPLCPRHAQSWAMTDLRQIGEPVRTAIRDADLGPMSAPGRMPPYCCSACKRRMIRAGVFKKSEWCEAFGAPPEIVRHHKVMERFRELRLEKARAGETWKPLDLKAQAESEIPPVGGDG